MLSIDKIKEISKEYGTPSYIFDMDVLEKRVNTMRQILGENVELCFAMKANPFLLNTMKKLDMKFEVCSPGEFSICEREKVNMDNIVLSGVYKEKADICHVMDDCKGVGIYTVESLEQYRILEECAAERKISINVILRLTSGNQFGLDEYDAEKLIMDREKHKNVIIKGIQCYSGTQKKKMSILSEEISHLDGFCESMKEKYGYVAEVFEYGPGLPYSYFGEDAYNNNYDSLKELSAILDAIRDNHSIVLEMGRYIAAECGIYISSVADVKTNSGQNYCIIDGGINHINYYGQTMAMKIPAYSYVKNDGTVYKDYEYRDVKEVPADNKWTVCGSLCTVADVIVKNLPVGQPEPGDMIVFYNIGAYSVTEGIYLFLSRKMPKIIAYNTDGSTEIYRDVICSDKINSRQNL